MNSYNKVFCGWRCWLIANNWSHIYFTLFRVPFIHSFIQFGVVLRQTRECNMLLHFWALIYFFIFFSFFGIVFGLHNAFGMFSMGLIICGGVDTSRHRNEICMPVALGRNSHRCLVNLLALHLTAWDRRFRHPFHAACHCSTVPLLDSNGQWVINKIETSCILFSQFCVKVIHAEKWPVRFQMVQPDIS